MIIEEIKGDLFEALKTSKVGEIGIFHVCNDLKIWGSGFVVPLGKNFPRAKQNYLNSPGKLNLGNVRFIEDIWSGKRIIIANAVAQQGLIGPNNPRPLHYGALAKCMASFDDYLDEGDIGWDDNFQIMCPRFGCTRAGGSWDIVREMINILWERWPIYVYYLED